jgi:uncharacterized protein
MAKKNIDWDEAERIIFRNYALKEGLHGLSHIKRVVENTKIIAKAECPQNFDDAVIGAYLHDIGRVDDSASNEHALRGIEIARRLLKEHWPHLDSKRILLAIETHADGLTTKDPIIGAIWDADRLDISRDGRIVNPELLSTKKGRELCCIKHHK